MGASPVAPEGVVGGIDAALACLAPSIVCDGRCVSVSTDSFNCGACGRVCGGAAECVSGACTLRCGQDGRVCGGRCVQVASDPDHCGQCDRACGVGESCMGGSCRAPCVGGVCPDGGQPRDAPGDDVSAPDAT